MSGVVPVQLRMSCSLCGEVAGEPVGLTAQGRQWRCMGCGNRWFEWNPGLRTWPPFSGGRG
jgi:hypothetical protein